MSNEPDRTILLNRRKVLRTLALGVGAGVTLGLPEKVGLAAQAAAKVNFQKGAIIRTILKDVTPESLGGGAILFHEHLSINDPRPSWLPAGRGPGGGREGKNAPTTPPSPYGSKIDLMVEELKGLKSDGVSCIVDGGTIDLGVNP